MTPGFNSTVSDRDEVILIGGGAGALSLELLPLREGVARAFVRASPRNLKLSEGDIRRLSDQLSSRPYAKILVQDNRKGLLRKALGSAGWDITRAIDPRVGRHRSMVTTYDMPLDEELVDSDGARPDLANTSHMHGLSIDVGNRRAWAFYTDDGETARVISEKERRQGFLAASANEDLFEAAECLVRFLASTGKSWAVFSSDLGRFVRKYDPVSMYRMALERPKAFDHKVEPISRENRKEAVRLFSEYYDESTFESAFRLRRYRTDKHYSVYVVNGGFVITRLEGETGLIFDIYVTPVKQGTGLGTELMRCALTDLAGKVTSCYLHTSYPRAKRLYEKFGFRTVYTQLGIRLDEIVLQRPRAR